MKVSERASERMTRSLLQESQKSRRAELLDAFFFLQRWWYHQHTAALALIVDEAELDSARDITYFLAQAQGVCTPL